MLNRHDVAGLTSLKLALYLLIALSLSVFTVQCEDAVFVSFDQRGTIGEPFEVSRTIAYDIHIQPADAMAIKKLELEVGPDFDDMAISKKFSAGDLSFYIGKDEAKDLRFEVNFQSPEMRGGDFGKWLSDKNETGVWDRAWYHLKITQVIGDAIEVQNYEGHPRLFKPFEEFRNAKVSPSKGTNQSAYSYSVEVQSNSNDVVALKVSPTMNGPWEDMGSKNYTLVGVWQKLAWDNISLNFDFNTAYYKFTGRKESDISGGPSWPVNYTYKNASVRPGKGLFDGSFTYGLDFMAEKRLNVDLNIWDIDSKTYRPVGTISYDNVSNWQHLVWPDIRLSENPDAEGSSSYYFSFYYPGSDKPIATTKDEEGTYAGPDIVLMEFENASVSPREGTVLAPFVYSVDVNAKPPKDVELETLAPGNSSRWMSQGTVTYDGSAKRLQWPDVKVDGLADGDAKYRFKSGRSTSDIFPGPTINSFNINASVTPYNGSLYFTAPIRGQIDHVYTYTYSAEFKPTENLEPIVINLEVFDPVSGEWIYVARRTYDPSQRFLNFTVNFAELSLFAKPFLGESKFRFVSEEGIPISKEFPGPDILVNFRNETHIEGATSRTYRVEVRSSLPNLPIALAYTQDNNLWKNNPSTRNYTSNNSEWKTLEWANYPKYYGIEYVALGV
jgi:hypothetical protein